jgi:hypothetical protein
LLSGTELGFIFRDTIWQYEIDKALLARGGEGPQEATVTAEAIGVFYSPPQEKLERLVTTSEVRWTFLPVSEPSVTLKSDPPLGMQVEKALTAAVRTYNGRIEVVVSAKTPPIGIAFDVTVHSSKRDQVIGAIDLPPGETGTSGADAVWAGEPPDYVDLVLTPSPKRAAETIDLLEIWGGVIVIRHVPVTRM